jgi:hypothetical protein
MSEQSQRELFVDAWIEEHDGNKPPSHWEICERCKGDGTLGGFPGTFTESDRAEWSDEDFEEYFTTRRACEGCDGTGKVLEFDGDAAVEFAEWMADYYADQRTMRAENGWSW